MSLWARLNEWARSNVTAAQDTDVVVVKTTRYLRLGMIALVIGLGVSVLYEHAKTRPRGGGHCWQESISAYYYTPVQSFLVAALVAIGISLIALKGSTEFEDVALNFAGMFAPIVAFVSTPNGGKPGDCGSVLTDQTNRGVNIGNNVTAMLVMAGVALVFLVAYWLWPLLSPDRTGDANTAAHQGGNAGPAGKIDLAGFAVTLVLYGIAWWVFLAKRKWVLDNAHWFAAITMFVFIFLAVLSNAVNFHFTRKAQAETATMSGKPDMVKEPHRVNRYGWVAGGMVLAVVVIVCLKKFASLDHATIWLETSMITLFGIFWVIQTHELWHSGLRSTSPPAVPDGGPGGPIA
jgi:hypothetical protein